MEKCFHFGNLRDDVRENAQLRRTMESMIFNAQYTRTRRKNPNDFMCVPFRIDEEIYSLKMRITRYLIAFWL